MSNEQLPKDPVTLDDLKRVIEAIHRLRTQSICHATELRVAERDAWRAAFEWLRLSGNVNRSCNCKWCIQECKEYDEGMALIREKLQS